MMKKGVIILILLLVVPLISAVEFDMKTNFSQGETLMAKISGNFLEPITNENVFLYRGHVRVAMSPHVAKIDDDFYIYAQLLGKAPNNYSIVIEDAKYMKGNQISEEDIVKNFSITEDTADFSIEPGFIITDNDFFIKVQNLQDYTITIQIKTNTSETSGGFFADLFGGEVEQDSIILKSGEIKKINFKLKDITQSTLETIELGTENLKYKIPVYIFSKGTEPKKSDFRLEPSELNISMPTNSNTIRIIYLHNTGEETLENISLSISDSLKPYISLSVEEIEDLEEGSSVKIEMSLSSDEREKLIEGQITAKTPEYLYAYSAITLNFLKDFVPSEEIISTTKTCDELGGKICDLEQEKCSKEPVYAKDNICCLGSCKKIGKSSTGKIIGWMMIIVVGIFLIWFFMKKYRGAKKPFDLLTKRKK